MAAHPVLNVPIGDDPVSGARIRQAVAESVCSGGRRRLPDRGEVEPGPDRPAPGDGGGERHGGRTGQRQGPGADGTLTHLVLDGAEVVATVIGASDIVICLADDATAGVIGDPGHGRAGGGRHGPSPDVGGAAAGPVHHGRGVGVGRGVSQPSTPPVLRIDKSVPLEVGRHPVLVHNAETLAQVALVARYGPEWFRCLGTVDAPGSTLVTVTGAVRTRVCSRWSTVRRSSTSCAAPG